MKKTIVLTGLLLSILGSFSQNLNQYQHELDLLNKEISENPENAKLFFQRANFYLEYRNFAEAQKDISKAISIDSLNSTYHLLKAKIYQLEGNTTQAIKQFVKLYTADTANLVYIAPLARLYESNRQLDKALIFFEKWSLYDSLNLYTQGKIAEIKLIQGKTVESVDILKHILQKDSTNLNALNWLSFVYFKLDWPDSAIILVDKGLQYDPENIKFLERAALIHFSKNHYYRALPFFKKVIELQDTTTDIALKTGMTLFGTNKYAEAIPFLQFAAQRMQDDYLPFRYLGECYYHLNDTANSVAMLEKAYELLFPKDMVQNSVEHSLARAYFKADKLKEAEKYYTALLKKSGSTLYMFEMARLQDEGFKDAKKALHWYSRFLEASGDWESTNITYAKQRESKLKEELHFKGELY